MDRMRSAVAALLTLALTLGSAPAAFAQRRSSPESDAAAYMYSAFLTQADPGVMARRVGLGPELQREFQLPASAEGDKVYEALIARAGTSQVDVRMATPQETGAYGGRSGLGSGAGRPLYTLEAGRLRYLLQFDLAQQHIVYVGQLKQ